MFMTLAGAMSTAELGLSLAEMIRRDKNHPCIIIWSMANECVTDREPGLSAMRRLMRRTRELDATRLVTFVVDSQDARKHLAFERVAQGFRARIVIPVRDVEREKALPVRQRAIGMDLVTADPLGMALGH